MIYKELIHNFIYDIILSIIIISGIFLCTYINNEIVWEEKYQNWEYNFNPSEGAGWMDAIVNSKEKKGTVLCQKAR